ncbi:MAG: iron ABC transporter permease [Spirochaetales bacterium]|nr:iron ABC transporter permease [Spirochaetales bacterium]
MHLDTTLFPEEYTRHVRKKAFLLGAGVILLFTVILVSLSLGAAVVPLDEIIRVLFGDSSSRKWHSIIFNIRLPRVLTAVIAGIGLSVSGTAIQSILRNPLGSPITLGISQAAAFGAALSVMIFGTGIMQSTGTGAIIITNPSLTTIFAFVFCMLVTVLLVGISALKQTQPMIMVLAGISLGFLFQAGTMFLQFFADDVQLAAMVFWTFGDVGRTSWQEFFIILGTACAAFVYFFTQRWNYNALDAGDETAKSLGVRVSLTRIIGLSCAALVTAVIISFVGIIGFIGLVCPHITRRILGDDHRFLLPGSAITGAIVLLAADTAARLILIPHVFPVAILTAFLGVPVFIFLIIRGARR